MKKLNNITDLPASPFELFNNWFECAKNRKIPQFNAMGLTTVNKLGLPSSRIVLLKDFSDQNGFCFFTNYNSRKAQELAENPASCLLFYWHELSLQIRIEGKVNKIPIDESQAYFATRPRASQISAWASRQGAELKDKQELLEQVKFYEDKFVSKEIPLPDFWGGFSLMPSYFEFWLNKPNRLHDRFSYRLQDDGSWDIACLQP